MKASKQTDPPEILHILGSASSAAPESTSSAAVDGKGGRGAFKLQALVYDILPSTTIQLQLGSRKLSANEQFFVGAQTVVRLLQTTQIKQGMSITAANKVNTSTNKTTIV